MLIKVQPLGMKQVEVEIEPTDKVETIKQKVGEKARVPATAQRLIYENRQMKNQMTAEDYKIQGGSMVYMTIALRG